MKISENPFYVLHLQSSAGRSAVVSASEEMSFLIDPDECLRAQNELINLGKRLGAEMGWFPEQTEDAIERIRDWVENGESISSDGFSPLSKLNASLYNLSISAEDDVYELGYLILDIDEQYASLNAEEIASVINKNRETAQLPLARESDVAEEIIKMRDAIRQTISGRLSLLDGDAYVELVTMLAEKCIADDDYKDGAVLTDVVDQYEVRMQAQIEEKTQAISNWIIYIRKIDKDDDDLSDDVTFMIEDIQEWDKLVQPLQLKSQASGMPHEGSEKLGREIRGLALHLHNEKDRTEEALKLVDAMKDVFAEMEELAGKFASDSDVLDDLLQDEKSLEDFLDEICSLRLLAAGAQGSFFRTNTSALLQELMRLDEKAQSLNLDKKSLGLVRERICSVARPVVDGLFNEGKRKEAYKLNAELQKMFPIIYFNALHVDTAISLFGEQRVKRCYANLPATSVSQPKKKSKSFPVGWIIYLLIAAIVALVIITIIKKR